MGDSTADGLAGVSELLHDRVLESRAHELRMPSNGSTHSLSMGQQVPVPNTTFNTSNSAGSSVVPVTSFTYQNVGFHVKASVETLDSGRVAVVAQIEESTLVGSQETVGVRNPIFASCDQDVTLVMEAGETVRAGTCAGEEGRAVAIDVTVEPVD